MTRKERSFLRDAVHSNPGKKIIVFGAGAGGQTVFHSVLAEGREVAYFVDNCRHGSMVCGKEVKSPYDILYEQPNDVLVIIGACQDSDVRQIQNQLAGFGLTEGLHYMAAPFNDLYAPLDLLDPILGFSRSGDLPGFRIHHGKTPAARKVVALGASTTDYSFGGYRSWPEVFRDLCIDKGLDVAVYNGGIAGYFSAQEALKLIRDALPLEPAAIVTFDGLNDASQQVLDRYPMYHPYSIKAFNALFANMPRGQLDINNEIKGVDYGVGLPTTRWESWYRNLRVMNGVCKEFHIPFFAFLQPNSLVRQGVQHDEKGLLINQFYARARELAARSGFITDATGIFDDADGVYYDFAHYTEKGNILVAQFVFERLRPVLAAAS